MQRNRTLAAAALVIAGLVWIGQGTGLLRGGRSLMVDDGRWAVIGAVAVTVGVVILIRERRTRA